MGFLKLSTSAVLLLNLYLAQSASARSCDGTQGITLKSNQAVIKGVPQCPENDGDIIETSDGGYYTFQCCMHESKGSTLLKNVPTTGYDDCINQCTLTDNCQAFRYVFGANGDEKTGDCKLYASGTFSNAKCGNTLHDWAYLTDPPVVDVAENLRAACSTECPDADGQIYTAKNKQVFHLDCQKRHGTAWFHKLDSNSLKECTESCASFIGCQSVDYHKRTKKCYLGKRTSKPTLDALGWASAYSLGCSGACTEDSCGNTCGSIAPPVNVTPLPEQQDPIVPANPPTEQDPIPANPSTPPVPKEVKCDDDNNSVVDLDGTKYKILCGKQYYDDSRYVASGISYTECLKLCSADQTCNSADYWDPSGGQSCYLFSGTGEPTYSTDMNWAAVKV
ncbi:uncharacterized protein N7479_008910 [Penicillium vulpinum]|uniref:Apple domain-containing protein n=1 Tax=Penicillium vulpinum TaxID=29845 RepID=A0A1V6RFI7_9EURO|nr:uncharacterized protein N7479_008910 [Penicillium vulpinum]KAJ5950497.1 hypothetical protein N7479_008910 [Penicillium vulpinum]OQE00386.1 hypothetical protein PENVUL_c053G07387 [Penicillium vulpinum]